MVSVQWLVLLFIGASPRGGLGANALCLSCDKPPKEQSAAIILVSKLPDMIALDYQWLVATHAIAVVV